MMIQVLSALLVSYKKYVSSITAKVLQCLYYMCCGHEVVGIDFLTSSGVYRKEIGVDCDSLSAIVIDVIRGSGV